ncbi:MAG TPA: hypothetical protein GX711_10170 [Clostridia bacterium]|nr:hypothetical protein [Clostridia bacterium]
MKNIFLTGNKQVGKSTLINRVLEDFPIIIHGFRTLPHYDQEMVTGFLMESLRPSITYRNKPYIGRQLEDGRWISVPRTFEEFGTGILLDCIESKPDLILMDELGFFETHAPLFQETVLKCLSSTLPVLGVIKAVSNPFLDTIRSRDDLLILSVDPQNRESRYPQLVQILQEVLA